MSTFPSLTGVELMRILRKQGFVVIRTKGSHHFLRHTDGRSTFLCIVVNQSGADY